MRLSQFEQSLLLDNPPSEFEEGLRALWYAKKGDWNSAHDVAQDMPSSFGSAIHAYLHREEGDIGNARYWYFRAGRSPYQGSLEEELESLVMEACD